MKEHHLHSHQYGDDEYDTIQMKDNATTGDKETGMVIERRFTQVTKIRSTNLNGNQRILSSTLQMVQSHS